MWYIKVWLRGGGVNDNEKAKFKHTKRHIFHTVCNSLTMYECCRNFETDWADENRLKFKRNPTNQLLCQFVICDDTPIYAYLLVYSIWIFSTAPDNLYCFPLNFSHSIHLFGWHLILICHLFTLVDFHFDNGLKFKSSAFN